MNRKTFVQLSSGSLAAIALSSCKKYFIEDRVPVLYNVMPFHPWDEKMLRLNADNPNGFEGATPNGFIRSFGLRTKMDNVKLVGGGSYDMEVFNNLQIACFIGGVQYSLQIQLGYCRNSNATGPFQESHSSIPNWPIPTIINGSVPNWKTGKQSVYMIYKVSGTTKWRTNIDGTDILEYETFDFDSYCVNQTCGTGIFTTGTGKFPTVNWASALELWDGTLLNGEKNFVQASSVRERYCASKVGIESPGFGKLITGTSIAKPPCGTIFW